MKAIKKLNRNTRKIILVSIIVIVFMLLILLVHKVLSPKKYVKSQITSTKLKTLVIDGHEIDFDPDTYDYVIALNNNETSLSISATAESNTSKVAIYNNDDLTKHDEVYIYVTNKDQQIRKYTISYTNNTARKYFTNNIEGCTRVYDDYCIKFFKLKNNVNDNFILFSYDKLTNDGYPNTNLITINDKLVFKKKLIDGEFHNFHILEKNNIIFTYNNAKEKNKMNLYAFNTLGNVSLNKEIINEEYKDLYTYYFDLDLNNIYVKTRYSLLDEENICKLDDNDIFEARYTIEYKNGSFNEPLITSKLTTLEYKIIKNINCKRS